MRSLVVAAVLAAAVLAACGDDPPAQTGQVEMTVEQQETQSELEQESGAARAESASRPENRTREQQSQTEGELGQQAERAGRTAGVEVEAVEEEDSVEVREEVGESAPSELTEVAAVVVEDAEMRVRPGLAWGVSRRLAAGDEVLVLSRIQGWLQIRVDVCDGWVRSEVLDLGEVNESEILVEAAAPIIAEWQGIEYGVMGQSADAAEVRLLQTDDEESEIVSAPKGEVTLLAEDITMDDLPVLIGDETVVFPGDDFLAGQGKILPRADEWMWLPWGWLLAHNEEYIWQWRPETDELEFIRRPPGFAKFSPDGSHLAIANLCSDPTDECSLDRYLTLLPLDGSAPVSLGALLRRAGWSPKLSWSGHWSYDLLWAAHGKAVRMSVTWTEGDAHTVMSLVVHLDGRLVRFDESGSLVLGERNCRLRVVFPGAYPDLWNLYPDDTMKASADCLRQGGEWETGTLVYSLAGEFLRFDVFDAEEGVGRSRYPALPTFDELGSDVEAVWSPSQRHALVTSNELRSLWLFDADKAQLRELEIDRGAYPERAFWGCGDAGFCWQAVWYGDKKLVAMWHWGGASSGGYLINVADGELIPLEFWSHGLWSSLTFPEWNSDGTMLKIRFSGIPVDSAHLPSPRDGLARPDSPSSVTAFVSDDGELSHFFLSDWKTPLEAWSPNGRWFATTR